MSARTIGRSEWYTAQSSAVEPSCAVSFASAFLASSARTAWRSPSLAATTTDGSFVACTRTAANIVPNNNETSSHRVDRRRELIQALPYKWHLQLILIPACRLHQA